MVLGVGVICRTYFALPELLLSQLNISVSEKITSVREEREMIGILSISPCTC